MGYKSYTTKKKPLKKSEQQKQGLVSAKEHQYWLSEWNQLIWSDEAHFELFNRRNRTFVRRLQTESEHLFNFVPKAQGSCGYVSIWRCMFSGAPSP